MPTTMSESQPLPAPEPVSASENVTLLFFIQQVGTNWDLERKIAFGSLARRYAKAMGVVFEVVQEPGFGRLFAFPLTVLESLLLQNKQFQHRPPDVDAVEFSQLLQELSQKPSHASLTPDEVRNFAQERGFFRRLFANDSIASQRSSFGWLCERFGGHRFPNGLVFHVHGSGRDRRFSISKPPGMSSEHDTPTFPGRTSIQSSN